MNSAKYTCHECDREGDGVAIGATGWFSYPPGWFLKDDDVVCSEACAAAFDGRDVKLVDEKVAGVGGAAVAGFIAGMAIRSIGNLLCEVATKVPCVRCGRPLIDHAKEPDEKCAGFEAKKFEAHVTLPQPCSGHAAPGVTELQAGCLRFARDGGRVTAGDAHPTTLKSCRHWRWLAPRGEYGEYSIITDGGLAALAHYDATVAMEKLWEGRRG